MYLLVVDHQPTPAIQEIHGIVAAALEEAAEEVNAAGILEEPCEIRYRDALEPDVEELAQASGVLLGTPVNIGYISGALKHYCDSTLYAVGERVQGIPCSYWMRGKYDTTGANKALRGIISAYQWEIAAEPVVFIGEVEQYRDSLVELAHTLVGALIQ